jgi:hypothetical protein
MLKEHATSLLIKLAALENSSEIMSALMKKENQLAETLGNVLITNQADKVKTNVLWIFANIMAEPD